MTNADKIRSMTDEELAEYFFDDNRFCCNNCPSGQKNGGYSFECDEKCVEHCLDWLKQEAEE